MQMLHIVLKLAVMNKLTKVDISTVMDSKNDEMKHFKIKTLFFKWI